MDTRKVGVVGAGTMGSGIARVTAVSGLEGYGDLKYRPCPLWREAFEARELGRKKGPRFLHLRVAGN